MSTNPVARLADELRRAHHGSAWHGPCVDELLADLSAQEAAAHGVEGGHTIAELVRHMAVWEEVVARCAEGQPWSPSETEDWAESVADPEADWAAAKASLRQANEHLLSAMAKLAPDACQQVVPGRDYDLGVMLHGAVQHTLYHLGQIALLKRALRG